MLGQLRERDRLPGVKMVEDAGLVLGNAPAAIIGADVLTMAGKKDCRNTLPEDV
jgi:hypothetical protein